MWGQLTETELVEKKLNFFLILNLPFNILKDYM